MAQNVRIAGVTYNSVPSIYIPKSGGGTAEYIDPQEIDADLLATLDADFKADNIKKGVNLFGIAGTAESGSGKAAQASDNMARVAATSYTSTSVQITVAKTGIYTVRWYGYRTSTSGTNGSQLYIGNTAYGSAQTTFSVNSNGQTVKLTGVSLTAGQTITVRARSRNTSNYMFVMGLSIIEE